VGDSSEFSIEPLLMSVASIRKRPGMFVGGLGEEGVLQLVLEVVANVYDQYLARRCGAMGVEIDADGTITVNDNGPGILLDDAVTLDKLLTTYSTRPTVDCHRPHMHLGMRAGLGLVVVNALSERFDLVTVNNGREARISFARGELVEPLAMVGGVRQTGTTLRFRPDPSLFAHSRVSRTALASVLEDLSFLSPGLAITYRFGGDDVAREGLRGRVAVAVQCPTSEVAHLMERHETAKGPIDVEVAVGWRTSGFEAMEEPRLHSFVNFARTPEHGVHVDGLIDGVCAFLGTDNRTECVEGLVAAVAVVLADVQYGNPSKNRLATPETQAPVASATRKALDEWANTHPEQCAALRARVTQFATVERVIAALDGALVPLGFARQERTYNRVTPDGLVHVISIDVHADADRFSRERRYAAFSIRLGVYVPEVARQHGDEAKDFVREGCCVSQRLETLAEPPTNFWPSDATVDVIPDVVARLERDAFPLLSSWSSRAALLARCSDPHEWRGWTGQQPRVIAAIILAEQGVTEEAKQLLAAQIAGNSSIGHQQYVRSLASRLGIFLTPT
jgi:DNA gyrase subunit B